MSNQYESTLICGIQENALPGARNIVPISVSVHDVASPTRGISAMGRYALVPVAVNDGDATLLLTDAFGRLQVGLWGPVPWEFAVHDFLHRTNGPQSMADYNITPGAVDDADAVRLQADAYGFQESAAFDRVLDSDKVVEQAPPEYDSVQWILRIAAVLPASGAFDTPVEFLTFGMKWLRLGFDYARAAGFPGSYVARIEGCQRNAGGDNWRRLGFPWAGIAAAGVDTRHNLQRNGEFLYTATSNATESVDPGGPIDVRGYYKFRVSFAEVGATANPGTLWAAFSLSN